MTEARATERRPRRGRRDRDPGGPDRALRRRRSNTELGLLVLALLVVGVAGVLVSFSQDPELPRELWTGLGGLAALGLAAHLISRRLAPAGDPVLLPLAFALNGLGLVMVRRIDFALAAQETPPSPLAPVQAVWTVVAVAAFAATIVLLRDHRALDRFRYSIGLAALVLLLLPLLPGIGREVNGARLWLQVGDFSMQPAEFAKLGLVAFFASYLAEKRQLLAVATSRLGPLAFPSARAFGPVLAAWALSLGILVLQNDFGLSLLFFGLFVVTLYVATARATYVVLAGTLFAGGAWLAYSLFAHVQLRLSIWLDPWAQYEGGGYQLAQSLFALGTGGLLGVGLGQGQPTFIPFVQTDFIFSAFGEELGLLGVTAILLCYFLMVGRGFVIAVRCRDDFGTLLAAGLTTIFALQTFVIVGGVTRLIPLTGLTLPFVSYGGSSLIANYVLIAVLVRISAAGERRPAEAES